MRITKTDSGWTIANKEGFIALSFKELWEVCEEGKKMVFIMPFATIKIN